LIGLAVLLGGASVLVAGPRVVSPEELLTDAAGQPVKEIAGFRLVGARLDSALALRWRALGAQAADPGSEIEVRLEPRDDNIPSFERTPSFNVSYAALRPDGPPEAGVLTLTRAVAALVRTHDPGGLGLALTYEHGEHRGVWTESPLRRTTPRDLFDDLALRAAFALLLAWLALLPFGVARATRDALFSPGAAGRLDLAGRFVLAALIVGVVLRWGLPYRLVLYYLGYEQAQIAATLNGIPKYGPAGYAAYHLVFLATGPSHEAMIAVNRALASLMPLFAAAVLARLGGSRRAVAWGAWLVAVLPVFPRNAATESLLVPMLSWLLVALHAGLAWRALRDVRALGLLFTGLLLAMLSRPEALGLAPLTVALLVRLGERSPARRILLTGSVVGAALLLLGARLVQLWFQMHDEIALGNTPQLVNLDLAEWALTMAWSGLVVRNAALWPSLFPAAAGVLSLLALAWPGTRRAGATLLVLAIPWFAASRLDLPYMSIPRGQEPGLLLVTLAAALGAAGLLERVAAWGTLVSRATSLVVVLGLAASSAVTLPALFEETNADDEEAFLHDALPLLPEGRHVVARRGFDDPPAERIPMHFPDYLVGPGGRTLSLQGLFERGLDGPTFVYLGTRCHLRRCDQPGVHPACTAVRERYRLRPLLERDVARRELTIPEGFREDGTPAAGLAPDHDFPYCAVTGVQRIGLYEIVGTNRPGAAR
jgi:hypothetical protein